MGVYTELRKCVRTLPSGSVFLVFADCKSGIILSLFGPDIGIDNFFKNLHGHGAVF